MEQGAGWAILSGFFSCGETGYNARYCRSDVQRPYPYPYFRLKGASACGIMVGCRVDGADVDLRDGHGNYNIKMYVADITDNCILGLDYLKAREAVIDLSQGALVVNGTIVKGEGITVRSTHKVILVNDCHLFPNSVSRATVRIQTGNIHTVEVQARKNGPYLVPNTLLMPGDVCLYIMKDSDSHIQLKDGMVVVIRPEALHIKEVSASDGLLTKWNGQQTSLMVPFIWMESLEWRKKITHC